MHRAAYEALGLLHWTYDAFELEQDRLADFVAGCGPQWAGFSVTMPLKRAVRPLLLDESLLATEVGAVNTVIRGEGGWHGYNTDVHGIVRSLAEAGAERIASAVVIGGGATAASALAALREAGCRRSVVAVRSAARAAPLLEAAGRLGVEVELRGLDVDSLSAAVSALPPSSVVVSTVPAEVGRRLAGALVAAGPVARRRAGRQPPMLLDVVYDPWPTPLAQAWGREGAPSVGGFEMLVHQAEGQVRLMTGRRVDVTVLRRAGQAELDRRGRLDTSN